MKNLIDKYINRIKVDYPEDDKLMIDLQDFAKEIEKQCAINGVVFNEAALPKEMPIEDIPDPMWKEYIDGKEKSEVELPQDYCTLNKQTCRRGNGCKYPHCHL